MYLVRLVVEGLKRAGVEHTHQVVKGAVIIGDDGKDSLLAISHHPQLHIVTGCNVGDLRENESGQPNGGGN